MIIVRPRARGTSGRRRERPTGWRYLRVGGRGFCFGAGKLEATLREMLENGAESHTSGARIVGRMDSKLPVLKTEA